MSVYKLHGQWTVDEVMSAGDATITVSVCNLINAQGRIHYGGAYKVEIDSPTDVSRKMWKGETAWNDAERYAMDACFKHRRMARAS